MLRLRVWTVLLGAPPFLICLWLGGSLWTALVLLLVIGCAVEAAGLMKLGTAGKWGAGGFAGLLLLVGTQRYGPLVQVATAAVMVVLVARAGIQVESMRVLAVGGKRRRAEWEPGSPWLALLRLFLAALYPALTLGHMVLLRQAPGGREWALFLVAVVWAADIGGYFSGLAWGRHRLAPRLSPGKSWEGAAGGLAAAALAGMGLSARIPGLEPGEAAGLAALLAVVGMVGDLVESALKRAAGAKDSGNLLPGHGGLLDRFDSMAFVAPVLFCLYRMAG